MKNLTRPLQRNESLRLMSITSTPIPPRAVCTVGPVALCLGLILQLIALPPNAEAQFFADDFNDGNDAGWNHYDPIAAALGGGSFAHFSFPNGAYRIQADASPAPAQLGPGRAASLRPTSYTNFYVAMDVVAWNNALHQVFGPLARVTNPGPGSTLGYAFTYQPGAHSISIAKITNEDGNDLSGTSKPLTLDPAKTYRLAFIGKGASLEGRVYELPDTRHPIATTSATDSSYTGGINGILVYHDPPPGTEGADATFDNYLESDVEPPVLTMELLPFDEYQISWPADATGFLLQTSTVVPSTNWTTIPAGAYIPQGNQLTYTTTHLPENTFFRLVRP